MRIIPGDFDDPQVVALLGAHVADMRENSPPGTSYALDLSGLKTPDITFYTAWDGGDVVGMAALKQIDRDTGEIKSMRTHASHLRKGVAAKLLDHVLAEARARGYLRVCLETGTSAEFGAAVALYRRYGFTDCACFGDYMPSPHNQFLHLAL